MDPREIHIVQDVLEEIVSQGDVLARHFVARLDELDSGLARTALDMGQWAHSGFITTLATVTSELANPHRILSLLSALVERHLRPWSVVEDLEHVRAALIWALQQLLGENFTLETERAWLAGCDMLIEQVTASHGMPALGLMVPSASAVDLPQGDQAGQ